LTAHRVDGTHRLTNQHENIKQLLALSRTIKELWVFGPLDRADGHRQEKEVQIDNDVQEVARLLDNFDAKAMRELAERFGGTYESQAAAPSSSTTATTQPTEPAPTTGN
jgi:hypothetical protein